MVGPNESKTFSVFIEPYGNSSVDIGLSERSRHLIWHGIAEYDAKRNKIKLDVKYAKKDYIVDTHLNQQQMLTINIRERK